MQHLYLLSFLHYHSQLKALWAQVKNNSKTPLTLLAGAEERPKPMIEFERKIYISFLLPGHFYQHIRGPGVS